MNATSGHEGEFTQPSIHLLHHLRIHAMDARTGFERFMIGRVEWGDHQDILSLNLVSRVVFESFHDRC